MNHWKEENEERDPDDKKEAKKSVKKQQNQMKKMQLEDERWSQVSLMTSAWDIPSICIVEEILFPQKVSS